MTNLLFYKIVNSTKINDDILNKFNAEKDNYNDK